MSFLLDSTPIRELPLLVEFEAKSIAEKFPAAKARMEQRGYVVSDYAQDGFALLKGDIILQGMGMDTLTDGSDMDSNVALERRNNRKRGRGQKSIDGGVSNELTGIETDKVVDFSYATDGTRAPKIATTHDGYIEPD